MNPGDLVEAVILLPENLFYNTTAPGIVIVLNMSKAHPGEVLLINASKLFSKGRPKNHLTEEHVEKVAEIYHDWREEEGVSAIVSKEEVARNDYNLSPSRYVAGAEEEAVVLLQEAEEEREEADRKLDEVLNKLGLKVRQLG
jgi:type I restriction enzyme M protein